MPARRFRGPQRFRLVFLLTMGVLASALAWLSWMVLAGDAAERRRAAREAAADRAVVALERGLTTTREALAAVLVSGSDAVPQLGDEAVVIEFNGELVRTWPEHRLAYVPTLPTPPFTFDPPELVEADRLFQAGQQGAALAMLRQYADSADVDAASQALASLAGYLVNLNRPAEALEVYERLRRLSTPVVAGMPAALAARAGELWVREQQGDRAAVARTAMALKNDLASAAWTIDEAVYQDLNNQADRVLGPQDMDESAPTVSTSIALAQGAAWLWNEARASLPPAGGQVSLATDAGPVLLVWARSGSRLVAFVATAAHVRNVWLSPEGVNVRLTDGAGTVIASSVDRPSSESAFRTPADTALPWTVEAFDDQAVVASFGTEPRQWLVLASLAVVLVVLVAGSWFVSRSVSRELQVAQLQADFVSAVSHEFRTPLTTLCQLSELLERGRVTSEEDRQTYYALLNRQSNRLRRLVEGVLDFGRLQSGKLELRKERVGARELVQSTIDEFAASSGKSIRPGLSVGEDVPPIEVDRDTLRLALWNLLDNAVKYSPGSADVHVDVTQAAGRVRIAVRDRGIGVPAREHERIFEKFSRGRLAREQGIAGTGIGLATAREIVRVHGGDIVLESAEGAGSTFTIVLPGGADASVPVPARVVGESDAQARTV